MQVNINKNATKFRHQSYQFNIGSLFLWIILFISTTINAQDEEKTPFFLPSIYTELLEIITQQDSFQHHFTSQPSVLEFKRLLNLNFTEENKLKKEWFQQQNKVLQKPKGLRWNNLANISEYYQGEENDLPINGVYLRTGLEYNLLDEGIIDNARKRKVLEKEYLIFRLEEVIAFRNKNYPYQYNLLLQLFNQQKIEVLSKRVELLEQIVGAVYKLYYQHILPYTTLNVYKGKLDESMMLLDAFKHFNQASTTLMDSTISLQFDAKKFPLLTVDLKKLLRDEDFSKKIRRRNLLQKEVIDLKEQQRKEKRLKVYGHLNYRTTPGGQQNSFWSFGTSFSMPIDLAKKEKEALKLMEQRLIDWENIDLFDHMAAEMVNLHHEYEYKMRTYVRFLYKLEHLREKARIETVKLTSEKIPHSPLRLIEIQEEKVAVEIELIDLKQQLYLKLLQLYRVSHHPRFLDCLENVDYNHIGKKLLGERFFLLEAEELTFEEANFLKAFLQKNELTNILLNGSSEACERWRARIEGVNFQFFVKKNKKDPTDQLGTHGYYNMDETKNFFWIKRDPSSNNWYKLVFVPIDTFTSRLELENWMAKEMETTHHTRFIFTNYNSLKSLEEQPLKQMMNN